MSGCRSPSLANGDTGWRPMTRSISAMRSAAPATAQQSTKVTATDQILVRNNTPRRRSDVLRVARPVAIPTTAAQSAPWATLQQAVDTVVAGDTVIVKAGTYNVGVNMFGLAGGTPTNPSPSKPLPTPTPASVIVTHCANAGTNADTRRHQHRVHRQLDHRRLHLDSDGSMPRAGIRVANSNNVKLINNTVNHAFTGIFVSNANNTLVQGNLCENSTDQHGIYISLATTPPCWATPSPATTGTACT